MLPNIIYPVPIHAASQSLPGLGGWKCESCVDFEVRAEAGCQSKLCKVLRSRRLLLFIHEVSLVAINHA